MLYLLPLLLLLLLLVCTYYCTLLLLHIIFCYGPNLQVSADYYYIEVILRLLIRLIVSCLPVCLGSLLPSLHPHPQFPDDDDETTTRTKTTTMADHRLSKRPEQSTSTSSQPLKSSAPCVRLSCEMCRQRKVKCDKLTPCTNCQRLRAVCVPVERARLPRGRTRRSAAVDRRAEPDPDLKDRVSRVEQLLQSLIHGGKCGDGTGSVSEQGGSLGRDAVSCRVRDQESVSELIQQVCRKVIPPE